MSILEMRRSHWWNIGLFHLSRYSFKDSDMYTLYLSSLEEAEKKKRLQGNLLFLIIFISFTAIDEVDKN
jgi:hypothetical protein